MTTYKSDDDYWYLKYLAKDKTNTELLRKNAKLRGALLLIREHKLPYDSFSVDLGSNGVRDYFINIAVDALND